MWGGSLFVRKTTPSSSEQRENRSYPKACSAGSPLRTAGQLLRTHAEWLWLIINTLGLWGSKRPSSCVLLSLLRTCKTTRCCWASLVDMAVQTTILLRLLHAREDETKLSVLWQKTVYQIKLGKKKKIKHLESPQVSSWQRLQALETEGIHKGHG